MIIYIYIYLRRNLVYHFLVYLDFVIQMDTIQWDEAPQGTLIQEENIRIRLTYSIIRYHYKIKLENMQSNATNHLTLGPSIAQKICNIITYV